MVNPILNLTRAIRSYQAKKFIKDIQGRYLLDIGCAKGHFVESFKHIETYGVDLSNGFDVEKEGLKGFKDHSFDYITMLAVIEHLRNHKAVLKECRRIIKPGGLLIITTPFKKADKYSRLYEFNKNDESVDNHIRHFTKNDFNFKGFKLMHYSTFEFGFNQLAVNKAVK